MLKKCCFSSLYIFSCMKIIASDNPLKWKTGSNTVSRVSAEASIQTCPLCSLEHLCNSTDICFGSSNSYPPKHGTTIATMCGRWVLERSTRITRFKPQFIDEPRSLLCNFLPPTSWQKVCSKSRSFVSKPLSSYEDFWSHVQLLWEVQL